MVDLDKQLYIEAALAEKPSTLAPREQIVSGSTIDLFPSDHVSSRVGMSELGNNTYSSGLGMASMLYLTCTTVKYVV